MVRPAEHRDQKGSKIGPVKPGGADDQQPHLAVSAHEVDSSSGEDAGTDMADFDGPADDANQGASDRLGSNRYLDQDVDRYLKRADGRAVNRARPAGPQDRLAADSKNDAVATGRHRSNPLWRFVAKHLLLALVFTVVNWIIHAFVTLAAPGSDDWWGSIQLRESPELWSGEVGFVVIYTAVVLLVVESFFVYAALIDMAGASHSLFANIAIGFFYLFPPVFWAPIGVFVILVGVVALWVAALRHFDSLDRQSRPI